MNDKYSQGEMQQIEYHHKEPAIKITLTLVKKLLKKAKTLVEDGHAYHLYECGHVIDNNDDVRTIKYIKGHTCGLRVCPICWENNKIKSKLLTKYKKCQCGAEHISLKIQPSTCCGSCSASRRALQGKTPNHELWNNGDKEDLSRCFCIHRRECLDEYRKYNVIPCKGCKKFKEKEGEWY